MSLDARQLRDLMDEVYRNADAEWPTSERGVTAERLIRFWLLRAQLGVGMQDGFPSYEWLDQRNLQPEAIRLVGERMAREQLPPAESAVCAIEFMTGDQGRSVEIVARQVAGNAQRLSESMPDRCAAVLGDGGQG